MHASCLLLGLALSYAAYSVQGSSERIIFTQLKKGFHLLPVVLGKRFTIDCSVNNKHMKISLYKKLSNGNKEQVKVDGKVVKRKEDVFDLVIKSYFESTDFYCHGELYGTAYEKEVKVVIIATTQELSPVPVIFPGLSNARVGETVKIECRCQGQLSVIKWFKAGGSMLKNNDKVKIQNYFNRRTRESTSMLSITNIDRTDRGVYRCQATSTLNPQYSTVVDSKVEIKDGDRIYWLGNSEKDLAVVKNGASTVLDCSLSNTEVSVAFYRLGRLGILYRIFDLRGKFETIGKQKLSIQNSSVKDMGLYICKAYGLINKKISLFVVPEKKNICQIFKPKGMKILCENSQDQFKEYIKGIWTQTTH